MAKIARYYAAVCQTDLPCLRDRDAIPARVGQLLGMVDRAVVGYEPFFDVKLVVFPEFVHAAPILSQLRAEAYTGLYTRPILRPGGRPS